MNDLKRHYALGAHAAMEKLGYAGGLLRQLGAAAKGAYKGLSPEAAQAVRHMGAGAGFGAMGSALTGDTSLGGLLGGAALGAGGGLGYSKLRGLQQQARMRQALGHPLVSRGRQLSLFG
jgi:hypothetical protein